MPQRARQDSRQQIPESPRLQTGPMFYITNTDAEAVLENTTLEYGSGILVKASGNNTNHWGEEGANGGNFTLNATKQELEGDITCDEISTVALSLADGSSYKGNHRRKPHR